MEQYSKLSDLELTVLLKNGQQAAFNEIFERYRSLLFIHADQKLGDHDDARDVVQDVFVRLWSKRDELEINSNLSGYLYRSVRNQIFNLIKHRKVINTYVDSFYATSEKNTVFADHLIREKQFAEMINEEIAALPPRMREVFELRRLENLSNKEVAQRLGITESTAADQMKKALKILKIRIGLILILAAMIYK